MIDPIFLFGLLVACFVAFNIGGATTGPVFGPAVGAEVISRTAAAALMSICFFAGAWTIGPRVVDTLGDDLGSEDNVVDSCRIRSIIDIIADCLLGGFSTHTCDFGADVIGRPGCEIVQIYVLRDRAVRFIRHSVGASEVSLGHTRASASFPSRP